MIIFIMLRNMEETKSSASKYYMVIDLKSFYASVECVARGLDPMTAKLVVADPERKKGTICLAVSPAMKALGVKNRCRVYEIPPDIEYIIAMPRMQLYLDTSAEIYGIYLKYVSKDDIHVYSIDEAFLDVTSYLKLYQMTPHELALAIMDDIQATTGLRATCGIGTNMYLAKIALDILAKHAKDYIAELDEESYKKRLWNHKPLTDFWRVGPGIARRLNTMGLVTMEDVAKCPEKLLYNEFGSEAEYLIDHSKGIEPTTIYDIKHYRQKSHSLSRSQILPRDYDVQEAKLALKEMVDLLCLDLVDAHVVTNNISLYIGYTKGTLPPVNSSTKIDITTNSVRIIREAFVKKYDAIVAPGSKIRKIGISCGSLIDEAFEQYSFFVDPAELQKDRQISRSVNAIRGRFGKNAILKGMNLEAAGTTIERNSQIGGHKA